MKTLAILALLLSGCGRVADVGNGYQAGVCSKQDVMACDHATGTPYYCQPPEWVRLVNCPASGCLWKENPDDASPWIVCDVY